MTMAMMKTNQNTSVPSMEVGISLVSARSKNCLIPPRSIQRSKPMVCKARETTACRTLAMM